MPRDNQHDTRNPTPGILVRLISAVDDCAVPSTLFERCLRKQARWDDNGQLRYCELQESNQVPSDVLKIFSDEGRFTQALSDMHDYVEFEDRGKCYSLRKRRPVLKKDKQDLRSMSLLVCFAFPVVDLNDPNFRRDVDRLQPLLETVSTRCIDNEELVGLDLRCGLAAALVGLARTKPVRYRASLLESAARLSAEPSTVRLSIALERSIIARAEGDYQASEDALRPLLRSHTQNSEEGLSKIVLGDIHRSHVKNLMQLNDPHGAYKAMKDQVSSSSLAELRSRPSDLLMWAKIHRALGDYKSACDSLQCCLAFRMDMSTHCQVVCLLSDTYCDRDMASVALDLVKAHSLDDTGNKHKRRIDLSKIDILIRLGQISEADKLASGISQDMHENQGMDMTDQLHHVRAKMAHAYCAHLRRDTELALARWKSVLIDVQKYKSFHPPGSTEGIIRYFIASELCNLGRYQSAQEEQQAAKQLLQRSPLDVAIPMKRLWFEDVTRQVDHVLNEQKRKC